MSSLSIVGRPGLAPSRFAGPMCGAALGAATVVLGSGTAFAGSSGIAGTGLVSVSAVAALASARRGQREALLTNLAQGLAALLGPPGRVTMRASRWRLGFVGFPECLRFGYDPGARTSDPKWLPAVLEVCRTGLRGEYGVHRHDAAHCVLELRRTSPAGPEVPGSFRQEHAKRAALTLLGAGSRVERVELTDDGQLVKRVHATVAEAVRYANVGHQRRLERSFSTVTPGRWRGLWDLENDRVVFELRPSLPGQVWLPPVHPRSSEDLLHDYRSVEIPFAVDEDGEELVWRPAVVPQFLMTGGTGTGKTSTSTAVVAKIWQHDWPVWILDGKAVEFLAFRDWPNVQVVATTVEQQVALIHRVKQLVDYRYRLVVEGRARKEDFEPLVVVLDEWAEFVAGLSDWYDAVKRKGEPTRPPTLRDEASLARLARTARVHLVKLMQRPDVALMGGPGQGGEVRSNFGMRATLGAIDPQGAQMMWGNPAVGVTIPRGTPGRGTALNAAGHPVEAQFYRFPDPYSEEGSPEWELLHQLRPKSSRWERLLIIPPAELATRKALREKEEDVPEDAEELLTFSDYAQAEWVRAADRPDIDPLKVAQSADPVEGRRLSSTMSMLGLDGQGPADLPRRRTRLTTATAAIQDAPVDAHSADPVDTTDPWEMYADVVELEIDDVEVGDLVQVDAEGDHWGVVQLPVEIDTLDPDRVVIFWGDFDHDEGAQSFASGETVQVRKPLRELRE